MAETPQRPRRRHGAELESALLDAAWEELVAIGYARLTMASVASRARTSEPVLYRRWSNKDELVLAALRHRRETHPVPTVDTGSLRGDLIGQLTAVSETLADFHGIAAAAAATGLLADAGLAPSAVRERVMDRDQSSRIRDLYRRADDRGEIDLDRIPEAVLAMPFDLVRHDLLMEMRPLAPARIRSIVDDLVLPLVRRAGD